MPDLYKLINQDILTVSGFNIELVSCTLNTLILAEDCYTLYIRHCTIKNIILNTRISRINCVDIGLETLKSTGPLKNLQYIDVSNNKLKNIEFHIENPCMDVDLSNNLIEEATYKIPHTWNLNMENNPIEYLKDIDEYIDYANYYKPFDYKRQVYCD